MRLLLAPMEGITGYIYRNIAREMFGGADLYYTPFITPTQTHSLTTKEMNDVLPEHNRAGDVIPQIMANNAEHFLWMTEKLQRLGYTRCNLNLGCPSRTVVTKGRGAGFLPLLEKLDAFFDTVFRDMPLAVSVKTRIGMLDDDALPQLMEIYNRYPIEELIIHPRLQTDFYQGLPRMEAFDYMRKVSRHPVVYNGNLFTKEDVREFSEKYPGIDVMLGRGAIANPALFRMIRGGAVLTKEELSAFHDRVITENTYVLRDPGTAIRHTKELWAYSIWMFPDAGRHFKQIMHAKKLPEYTDAVQSLLHDCVMDPDSIPDGLFTHQI